MIGSYDIIALLIIIILDIILGYVRSIFIDKNFNISISIRSLIMKSSLIITILFIDFIINLAYHLDVYSKELQGFIDMSFNAILILACISELISVLANLSIITGIDFNNITVIKNAIKEKEKK